MKKQLIIFFMFLLPLMIWSAGTLDLSLGYGIPGDWKSTYNDTVDNNYETKGNMCISAEYIMDIPLFEGLFGGFGVHYQGTIELTEFEEDKPGIAYIPLYLQGGYKCSLSEITHLRGLINLGYDFLKLNKYFDDDFHFCGGFYFGGGLGFEFNERIFIDALYNHYTGGREEKYGSEIDTWDVSQDVILIRMGVKLPEYW